MQDRSSYLESRGFCYYSSNQLFVSIKHSESRIYSRYYAALSSSSLAEYTYQLLSLNFRISERVESNYLERTCLFYIQRKLVYDSSYPLVVF
jgi:hypothetical protein